MDLIISFQQNYALFLGVVFVVLVLQILWSSSKRAKNKYAPEATGASPILGHFKIFGGSSGLPHIALGSMADKYGPIFKIRLGIHKVLVVNNWEMAKEIFTKHDSIVLSRPKFKAIKILGYDYVMFGFTPYGPYWKEMRKIASFELLSNRSLEKAKHVRISELENSIQSLYKLWKEKKNDQNGKVLVDMQKWFGELDMNVMFRLVVGRRYSEAKSIQEEKEMSKFHKVMREFFHYLGLFVVADALPFLGWLDLGGHEKSMKRVAKEIDYMFGKWLDEHRRKRESVIKGSKEKDFMDVMIDAVETGGLKDHDADAVIKSACLDILASSADTITVMLTWTLSLLLNNPHTLRKVQEEIDQKVGKDREIVDSDINKLVYLQAAIKETLRLYPAAPLGAPRQFSEDCNVAGYHIPKGTWLMVNIWKIQHDPEIWTHPSEFRPERFIDGSGKNMDVKGRNFELIPYGAGRRFCPGIALSLQMLHIVLATLLQKFDISTPNDELVDMSESFGLVNAKASPLEVLIVPRLNYF